MTGGIVIDARKLGDGGIGVYIENLIYGLLELPEYQSGDWKITLLVEPGFVRQANASPDMARLVEDWREAVTFVSEKAQKYSIGEYFQIASRHRDLLKTQLLYHSPHYTLPYNLPIPAVVTIHDVIHLTHPDTFLHRVVGKQLIASAVRRSARVITVSEASAHALSRVIPASREKIAVIPNSLRYSVQRELDQAPLVDLTQLGLSRKNYFIFVGSDRPHKGLAKLIDAWSIFRKALTELQRTSLETSERPFETSSFEMPKVLAIGHKFGEDVRGRVASLGIEGEFVFRSRVTTSELAGLQRQSAGVVIPSLEEGFGLVALEAICLGVPVVCFPVASLREVCGEAGWFASDFTPQSLADVMLKLVCSPALAVLKCRYGKRLAGYYNLRNFAQSTQDVYCQMIGDYSPRGSQKSDSSTGSRIHSGSFLGTDAVNIKNNRGDMR